MKRVFSWIIAPKRLCWLVWLIPIVGLPITVRAGHIVGWDNPGKPGAGIPFMWLVVSVAFAWDVWRNDGMFWLVDSERRKRRTKLSRTRRRRRQ